jgi:hypothetical protein
MTKKLLVYPKVFLLIETKAGGIGYGILQKNY